jgi:hypothetical protein
MMGRNDGPALDGTNPFSTPPAPQAQAQATPGIPTPARRRRSRRQFPASSRCRRDGPSATADCPACPGDGSACRSWPYARCWAGRLLALPMPATPVIPDEQECDAIEDALEKDMNYLIFLANAPISAAAAMTISLLQSGFEGAGRSDAD